MTRGWVSHDSRCTVGRRGGFTLLEMLAVVFIIGLSLALVLPNLDNLTPKHRLRAAAREVAATMELCRHQSVTKAATYGIRYEIDRDQTTYRIILPEDEMGEREALSPRRLPAGVVLKAVVMPDNDRVSFGEVEIDFSPTGEDGAHMVILENNRERAVTVKFQPLVGLATFRDGEAEFEEYRGG